MFDDLANYFHHKVWKDYEAYSEVKKDRKSGTHNDLRMALHAAESLYHLREHIPQTTRKSRNHIAKLCPDYDLLGDVFNAAKHGVLTIGNPKINNATDIQERIVRTRYKDEQGECSYTEKGVFVKLNDGSERDLFVILTNVLNFWLDELNKLGVIEYRTPIKINNSCIPSRDESELSFEFTRGLKSKITLQLLKYNYLTKTKELVDLTGLDIVAKITQLPVPSEADIVLTNNKTGEEIKKTMKLTEEEGLAIIKMGDEQIQEFLMKLAIEKGIFSKSQTED